jgi:glycosyltransferase involved in cell wall biosynthesis
VNVLAVTNMYPSKEAPGYGAVVHEQLDSLRALGLSVDVLKIGGAIPANTRNVAKYLHAATALRRTVAATPPDVIHAHYGLSGAIASLQRRFPVVTTFHGSDTGYVPWQGRISWAVARLTTPIFVCAEGANRLGVRSAAVIPCGVDVSRFRPIERGVARKRLGWDESGHYILLPGSRQQPVKRAELFDEVIERVRLEIGDVVGVSLEQTPRSKVPLFMNAADVTLMTSESEGSPVTIKESLACLTPVVSVPVGDVPGLIESLPGCSVAGRDPESLARGVIAAFAAPRSPVLRQRACIYALSRIAERVAAVYESLLAKRVR